MAVTIADITKLRKLTGAGLADCKKALEESDNNIDAAIEIIRAKGQAVAAKRSDRDASEGCVLAKYENGFAAIIALKCETDFVANNADFVKLTRDILDLAVANKCKDLEEVKALTLGGVSVAQAVVDRSGITGEKMELDGYMTIEGENVAVYDHMGKHTLATMVQLSQDNPDAAHKIAMQVAAMRPVALDEASVPQQIKDQELEVAIQKTKEEQVEKAVVAALKKAGINANLVDSDDHIESNMAKGWLTQEEADRARQIKKETAEQKAANLPEQMIQNIAQGRMAKFFKENCLAEQEFQFADSAEKVTVTQWLQQQDKDLKVLDFKRFTLRSE
ncbi:MAG: elongation factor Ts [Bacteroidaceae bacterium]|jgi:elongation factor Ts|nr:elongation factor Ts [Bacteroidaceae bacterium]MBQ2029314.1 elongation factor Ts [Bacteroidaceae bacterium]